jgi:hypothetical protein
MCHSTERVEYCCGPDNGRHVGTLRYLDKRVAKGNAGWANKVNYMVNSASKALLNSRAESPRGRNAEPSPAICSLGVPLTRTLTS